MMKVSFCAAVFLLPALSLNKHSVILAEFVVRWANDTYTFSESVGKNAATTLETTSTLGTNVTVLGNAAEVLVNVTRISHPSVLPRFNATIRVVYFRGSRYSVGTVGGKYQCAFL